MKRRGEGILRSVGILMCDPRNPSVCIVHPTKAAVSSMILHMLQLLLLSSSLQLTKWRMRLMPHPIRCGKCCWSLTGACKSP
jgi:hypothetical protein